LPALAGHEEDYRLWVSDAQAATAIDAGVVSVEAKTGEGRRAFRMSAPITEGAKFEVRIERKDGVSRPEGTVVLRGP